MSDELDSALNKPASEPIQYAPSFGSAYASDIGTLTALTRMACGEQLRKLTNSVSKSAECFSSA